MTPKDAATCAEFWTHVRALTEIAHTRGSEGLVDALMEDFAHLPAAVNSLVQKQLTTLMAILPVIKQAAAVSKSGESPSSWKIPYRT
jgi:hypothetical protein